LYDQAELWLPGRASHVLQCAQAAKDGKCGVETVSRRRLYDSAELWLPTPSTHVLHGAQVAKNDLRDGETGQLKDCLVDMVFVFFEFDFDVVFLDCKL
jgi:hypothetical protein